MRINISMDADGFDFVLYKVDDESGSYDLSIAIHKVNATTVNMGIISATEHLGAVSGIDTWTMRLRIREVVKEVAGLNAAKAMVHILEDWLNGMYVAVGRLTLYVHPDEESK